MRSDDPKIIVQLAPDLLAAVDDFRFGNRLDSRAEAIRLLLQRGLDAGGDGAVTASPPLHRKPRGKPRVAAKPAALRGARLIAPASRRRA